MNALLMKKPILYFFSICFFIISYMAPLYSQSIGNDDCAGAINIVPGTSSYMDLYSNIGATLSMPACASTAVKDIWFKFTASATRHQVISRSINSEPFIAQFFTGSCGNLTSILCRDAPNGTTELVNLTPGATYYYRLYLKNGSSSTTNFNTYVTTPALPANDEPAGAIPLAVNTSLSSTLNYATESYPACYPTGYDAKDVWYKFVATSTSHNFSLTPVSFDELMFQVYSGSPTSLSSIYCSGITGYEQIKTAALTNLVIGNTYYIRVHNRYGDASPSVTYSIRMDANNPLANDDCAGAINIAPGTSSYMDLYSNIGATLSMPACSSTAVKDIWFKFTATATRHQVISRSINSEPFIAQFFTGNCGNLTSILCRDAPNGTTELVNLTPGTTYYYRLYLKNGSSSTTNFNTYVTTPALPPNDEPGGAISLTVNASLSTTLAYATQSFPACYPTGYDAKDVWYKFVATSTSHNLSLAPVSFDELMFQVYSGSPTNLSSIYCSGIAGYEQIKTAALTSLVIGNTYYIRVHNRYGDASPSVTYSIRVDANNPPANDDCAGAINIAPGTSSYMDLYSNIGATLSMPACASTAIKDIWFKFTATATRHQVISRSINSEPFIAQFFTGSCDNLTSILCRDAPNGTTELVNLTPGTTYYYRLYLKNGSSSTTNFNTYVTTPALPANDEPVGAIPLTVNASLSTTLAYATQSFAACYPTGYDAKDVWYKFVATSTSHNLSLTPVSFDELMFQVYSGSPTNLTSIYCSGIAGYEQIKTAALTKLVVGNTYYIRVHNRYGDASPSVTYILGLIHVNVPPPVISSFSPTTAAAGTMVTITGSGLADAGPISFGNMGQSNFTILNANSIRVVLGDAKSGRVSVTTPVGTSTLDGFLFVPVPVISAEGQTTFASGGAVKLTANTGKGYYYVWCKNGVEIIDQHTEVYTAKATGAYTVSIITNGVRTNSNPISVTAVFVLPPNNFSVQAVGETCKHSGNGSINISANQDQHYKATVIGNGVSNQIYNFTNLLNIKNLSEGIYSVCITIDEELEYKQCYEVVVTAPKDLSVYSVINEDTKSINLQMSGGEVYSVNLNGTVYKTSQGSLSLPLKYGSNEIQVSTDKACQGIYNKAFSLTGPSVYPNPFVQILNVFVPGKSGLVEIRNLNGKLVYSQTIGVQNQRLNIDLGHIASGMYVVKIKSEDSESFYKVIKK